ncbi:MAG: HD domain-containing phosphohydrolase [Chloroflexota bacterium]
MPFAIQIAIPLILLLVVTIGLLSWYGDVATHADLVAATRAQDLQRARGTAQVLDDTLAHALAHTELLARAPNTVELAREPNNATLRASVGQEIRQTSEAYHYDYICVIDRSGTTLIATAPDKVGHHYLTLPAFRNAIAGRVSLDDPRYDPEDQQVFLYFSAPIRDAQGAVEGAVLSRIALASLDRAIVGDTNYAGRDAVGVLWNDLGIRLAHGTRPDLRFTPLAPLTADIQSALIFDERYGPATRELLNRASAMEELIQHSESLLYDPTGDPHLVVTDDTGARFQVTLVPLTKQRWLYGIFTSEAKIFAVASDQANRMRVITIGVVLAAVLLLLLAAHRIARPIRVVADAANALAAGDRSRRVRLNQRDEVGQLASAFNAMADTLGEKEDQLREYAQTLEQRVEERAIAVVKSEEKYRALMDNASDAILIANLQGTLLDANRKAEELLGYPKTQLVGMRVEQIHPPQELPRTLAMFKRVAETGSGVLRDGFVLRQDGKTIPVEITGSTIEYAGERIMQSIFHDMTAQKQRERELQAIATMANALRAATTRAEMLPIILDQVMYLLDAPGADLGTRDPVTGETLVELGRGRLTQATGLRMPVGKNVAEQVIATSQPYVSNDAENDPLLFRSPWLGKISAFACVPLIAQNETVGALFVGRDHPIGDAELRILTTLADMAANAIHRAALYEQTARLFEQAQQNIQRLTALRAVDQAITASLDLRLTLRVLLDQVVTYLQADAADVWLFNPPTQTLKYTEGYGFTTRATEHLTCRLGEGYAGQVAFERRVAHIPDLRRAPDSSARAALLAREGFVAYLGAPLIAKGQLKGVLEIFLRHPLTAPEEWLDFIEALALQTAIAIDSVTLFDDLQRSNLELSLASEAMIESWARALELRGRETDGHIRQVAKDTVRLARALGIGEADLIHVQRGALLHDIGKIGVPDSILFKPGPLTESELAIIHQHPVYSRDLLAHIEFLKPALDIPYCHHEKWDGSGYPRGLQGEAIPLAARAFAIVDCWNTLRADRAYSPAWDATRAMNHLREQSGKAFDPQVVNVFLKIIENEP